MLEFNLNLIVHIKPGSFNLNYHCFKDIFFANDGLGSQNLFYV